MAKKSDQTTGHSDTRSATNTSHADTQPPTDQTITELNQHLEKLERRLNRRVSVKFNLAMSLLQGAAAAIGATIVAGVLVAWLVRSIRTIEDVPVLNRLITPEIKEAIETNYPETQLEVSPDESP